MKQGILVNLTAIEAKIAPCSMASRCFEQQAKFILGVLSIPRLAAKIDPKLAEEARAMAGDLLCFAALFRGMAVGEPGASEVLERVLEERDRVVAESLA